MNQRIDEPDDPDDGLVDDGNDSRSHPNNQPSAAPGDGPSPGKAGPGASGSDDALLDVSDPQQVAAYVLDMTLALRNVASNSGMDFLAYLLDMAAEESLALSRRVHDAKISQVNPVRKAG